MKIPEHFVFDINEKKYQVSFEVDLYNLSFSLVCPPSDFEAEVVKFFEERSSEKEITVRVLVLEKNDVIGCFDMVPLLVFINPLENNLEPTTKEDEDQISRIFQFQQFTDQLCANGELKYLHNGEE